MTTVVVGGLYGGQIVSQGFGGIGSSRGCVGVRDASRYSIGVRDESCGMVEGEMGYNVHNLGDLVTVTNSGDDSEPVAHAFTDESTGVAIDPDAVSITIKAPDGTVTSYVYGTDIEVVRDGVGLYHMDVDANQAGTWFYRFESTGVGQAAEERRFIVREAQAIE